MPPAFTRQLPMYGLLISLAILLGVYLCGKNTKRLSLPKDAGLDVALWGVPAALIGARVYYVIFRWQDYAADPLSVFRVWEGGLAIYGGVIGGLLGVYALSRVRKVPFWALVDMTVPSLLLGQAIGRWGNFFNQEAYGNPVTDPSLQFFPLAVLVQGNWYQATFFYESMWDLAGFLILWFTRKKWRLGDGLPLYMIVYGLGRVWIEGLRSDSLYVPGTAIRVSQVLSGAMVLGGIAYFLIRARLPGRKDGAAS